MGGSRGIRTPPPFGPLCRLVNIGPKIGPPPGSHLVFACRPKMDPPPPFKNPGSAPVHSCYSIELWCAARCINYIKMACESKNVVVKTIANMGINGSYSIMGGNKRHIDLKFGMNKNKIHDICVKMNVP